MQQELSVSIMECNYIDTGTRTVWGILIKKKKIKQKKKTLPIEKAESNHLTASSTWISNQQTRTVETDRQMYCLELLKETNNHNTT